jgi:NADP-dependent 3-hydroxy acid dehydrogenase YdfG
MRSNQEPEVVVVTGAAGGADRAIAHAFAKRGAHIGLPARGPEPLEGVRREIGSFGGRGLVVPADPVANHPSPALKLRQEPRS